MNTSNHTPKPDAAADLAGVPRPVSTEDVRRLAESHKMVAETILEASTLLVPRLRAKLHTDTETMLRTLVSERDALAVRVSELEAARAGWEVINIGQRPAACDGATSWSCCDTGRCEHDHDNARADASWREFDAALTTPESKP